MKKQASSSYIMNRKSWRRRSSLLSVLKRMFRGVVRVGRGRLQATHDEHNEVNCHAKHETQSKGGGHQHGDMLSTVFFNIAFLSIINRWKLKWRKKRVIFKKKFLLNICRLARYLYIMMIINSTPPAGHSSSPIRVPHILHKYVIWQKR